MIVIVSVNNIQMVVPCNDGKIHVEELMKRITHRYNDLPKADNERKLEVYRIYTVKENALLHPNDLVCDVCADREMLYCKISHNMRDWNDMETIYKNINSITSKNRSLTPTIHLPNYTNDKSYHSCPKFKNCCEEKAISRNSVFGSSTSLNNTDVYTYFEVTLTKTDTNSVGLSLHCYDYENDDEEKYIYVKEVMKGGPAFLDGRIHNNDRIVNINSQSICNWSLNQICDFIKNKNTNLITFGLTRKMDESLQEESANCYVQSNKENMKYFLKMPFGFDVDDIGIVFNVCCGVKSDSNIPCVFISVASVLKTHLFELMFKKSKIEGHVVRSLMELSLEDMSEGEVIAKLKEAIKKFQKKGTFEIVVTDRPHEYQNILTILESCTPSFFLAASYSPSASTSTSVDTNTLTDQDTSFMLAPYAEKSSKPHYSKSRSFNDSLSLTETTQLDNTSINEETVFRKSKNHSCDFAHINRTTGTGQTNQTGESGETTKIATSQLKTHDSQFISIESNDGSEVKTSNNCKNKTISNKTKLKNIFSSCR